MAHIRMNRRKWRAQVERCGVRRSKMFEFLGEAKAWAAAIEAEILSSARRSPAVDGPLHAAASAGAQGGAA